MSRVRSGPPVPAEGGKADLGDNDGASHDVDGDTSPEEAGGRSERDREIFRLHLRGIDTADLVELHGLSPRRIREIVQEQKAVYHRLSLADPVEIVEDLTSQIDAGISELAAVAASAKGSVRLAATSARINALFAKGKWLQATGVIPQDARHLRTRMDSVQLARTVLGVLDEHEVLTDELTDDLIDALDPSESGEQTGPLPQAG